MLTPEPTLERDERLQSPECVFRPVEDHECERTVIASVILDPKDFHSTLGRLKPSMFRDRFHARTYEAVLALWEEGTDPGLISVTAKLNEWGETNAAVRLSELVCRALTARGDIGYYSERLRALDARNTLRMLALEMLGQSTAETTPVEEIRENAMKRIADMTGEENGKGVQTLTDVYKSLQEHMLVNRSLEEGEVYGSPTGFEEIDRRGGLIAGDLIVIGAETSKGKTSFANALALSAVRHGHPVAFYSMEMSPVQLNARIASMLTGINARRIMYEKMDMDEIYRVDSAMEGIDGQNLLFDGRSVSSLDSILSSLRTMVHRHGIKGAVVDYLQLVSMPGERLSREQAVARIARDLKNAAKDLGIWIIAISQLSRDSRSPVPSLARLRDSGQIEEAADNIFLIHRTEGNARYPEPHGDVRTQGTAMVIIAKGRNSGTGSFVCSFNPQTTLFSPLSETERAMQTTPVTPDMWEEPLPF